MCGYIGFSITLDVGPADIQFLDREVFLSLCWIICLSLFPFQNLGDDVNTMCQNKKVYKNFTSRINETQLVMHVCPGSSFHKSVLHSKCRGAVADCQCTNTTFAQIAKLVKLQNLDQALA